MTDVYEAEQSAHGGRSLARIATIVVSSGSFFVRLRQGKPFLVSNLDKLAAWFRDPANWPMETIPHDAAVALASIGRPPLAASMPHTYRTDAASVACEAIPTLQGAA